MTWNKCPGFSSWLQDSTYHKQCPRSKDHIIWPPKQPITTWYFQFNRKTLLNMIHFLTVYPKLLYLNFKLFLQVNSSCNTGHHTAKLSYNVKYFQLTQLKVKRVHICSYTAWTDSIRFWHIFSKYILLIIQICKFS